MKISEVLADADIDLLDAEVLLAYALGESREWLVAHGDDDVAEGDLSVFKAYVERRKAKEPVAYIVRGKEFYGLDFYVDSRVLVPRPETEMLVDEVLEFCYRRDGVLRILDVGTGSGCVAVSVAKNLEKGWVDAVDVSDDALEVAKLNVEQQGVEDKVHVFHSDLLEGVEEGAEYDVIVANLPYIPEGAGAPKYEPEIALFAGEDGLDLYRRMFEELKEKNVKFGMLIGEFGFGQTEKLGEVLSKYFDQQWQIKKDLADIDRMFIIKHV